jgi:hypothetical protein
MYVYAYTWSVVRICSRRDGGECMIEENEQRTNQPKRPPRRRHTNNGSCTQTTPQMMHTHSHRLTKHHITGENKIIRHKRTKEQTTKTTMIGILN